MDIHRLIDSQSRPFHVITAHHQASLFHGIVGSLEQRPHFLLTMIGFLGDTDQLAGERLTLAVQDLIPFLRKTKFLLSGGSGWYE